MPVDRVFPAEWAPQDAVIVCWPHHASDWQAQFPEIEIDYLSLAIAILESESLIIICRDKSHRQHIESLLPQESYVHRIIFAEIETNDTWCRDFGPITVIKDQQPLLFDFQFNGWGNRYASELDNRINQELHSQKLFNAAIEPSSFILEGGSIETDGEGTLLTTESCLLNRNRGHSNKKTVEVELHRQLAVKNILWLKSGWLAGDDTDNHIDNLARFTSKDTIAYAHCENRDDIHFDELEKMSQELSNMRQIDGQNYKLVPVPLPDACYHHKDYHRLPASYLNFLITNQAVLVPAFGKKQDKEAKMILQKCFPDRRIIAIKSNGFVQQNGGLHCLTMQLPRGTLY